MPFVSALADNSRRRSIFFKQGIKIAARRQRFHNFLEALLVVAHSTIGCIRKYLGCHFGIKFGRFTRANSHFTTICEDKHQFGAIGGHNTLAFANRVSQI